MEKCLHCQKELVHVEGRKKKQFCGSGCRSNYWYAKNHKGQQKSPKTEKTKVVPQKPETPKIAPSMAPKTLLELKALCPKSLTGFERSEWIAIERQKYNI